MPAGGRRASPWWIPPFLGRAPGLDPALLGTLGVVALALLFESYDLAMITSALPYIARDFAIPEEHLSDYLGLIRLGAFPAFLLIPFADRFGRRRVFLIAVICLSGFTVLTAFTQSVEQYVACQMAARTFFVTGQSLAFVIVTEEFPAEHRGWGIGMLAALGQCGFGLAALLFAFIDWLPFEWRTLYAVGALPLLLLPAFRRNLQETARFNRYRSERAARGEVDSLATSLRPILYLVRAHPARAAGIGILGLLAATGQVAAFQFTSYHAVGTRGWEPWQFSVTFILGGALGIIGNVAAGRLGDRIGRRFVGLLFLVFFPVFVSAFYRGPGWVLPPAWVCFVFSSSALSVVIRALSTELFPTSHRGTAAGFLALVESIGAAAGLFLVGYGTRAGAGSTAEVASLVSALVLLGAPVLLLLPETGRRELETLSHEVEP